MVDAEKEQEEQSANQLEQLLDCERKRAEDYLTRLSYLQADLRTSRSGLIGKRSR